MLRANPGGLEIRPLTLILGRNSSGKSAIIKLLRIALRAIGAPVTARDGNRDPGPGSRHLPLSIGKELPIASRFIDLVHGRLPKEVSIGLDLEINGQRCGYEVALLPADAAGDRSWLMRFEGYDPDPSTPVKVELDLDATSRTGSAVYRGGEPTDLDGLAPAGTLTKLRRAARTLEAAISHLGPLRAHIAHVKPRAVHPVLDHDGGGAADLLAGNEDLAISVDDWYREHLDGCRLQVRPLIDAFELLTTTADGTAINLAQAGEGLHQALPVVVQQKLHETDDKTSPILDIVEQPELHLHDAVHPPLADLFMATARQRRGVVIVETHSEGLLLRVRRRIAEGTFDPADLAIYFVDSDTSGSYVRSISINNQGELSEWPEGVFLESYREVLKIQQAIRARVK
jgi:AAA ATPase domain/Protein of unknown function (DUF3696)